MFSLGGFPCRNDTELLSVISSFAMNDNKDARPVAHSEQNEPVFIGRLIIIELHCELIIEDRLSFLEGDSMLLEVGQVKT